FLGEDHDSSGSIGESLEHVNVLRAAGARSPSVLEDPRTPSYPRGTSSALVWRFCSLRLRSARRGELYSWPRLGHPVFASFIERHRSPPYSDAVDGGMSPFGWGERLGSQVTQTYYRSSPE